MLFLERGGAKQLDSLQAVNPLPEGFLHHLPPRLTALSVISHTHTHTLLCTVPGPDVQTHPGLLSQSIPAAAETHLQAKSYQLYMW